VATAETRQSNLVRQDRLTLAFRLAYPAVIPRAGSGPTCLQALVQLYDTWDMVTPGAGLARSVCNGMESRPAEHGIKPPFGRREGQEAGSPLLTPSDLTRRSGGRYAESRRRSAARLLLRVLAMVTVRLATLLALWVLKKPSPESLQIQRLSTATRLGAIPSARSAGSCC
jgi:hypothetical protein